MLGQVMNLFIEMLNTKNSIPFIKIANLFLSSCKHCIPHKNINQTHFPEPHKGSNILYICFNLELDGLFKHCSNALPYFNVKYIFS